jgi:muramoyltetrapeptide carboxypeptidase
MSRDWELSGCRATKQGFVCKDSSNRDIRRNDMNQLVDKPAPLRPGDRIAVVAPSGGVVPERLDAGIAVLERRGFLVTPPAARAPFRLFSGRDEERRGELLDAFADDDVRAVWFARGGYGMNRLLPDLDPLWLAGHPKLCIGFSDATAFLQWLLAAGLPSIHGPMVAHDLVREEATGGLDHLLAIAAGSATWSVPIASALVPGGVEGRLAGGCLSVLTSLAGTPYQPDFDGAIVLLEDTHERPQRKIDRMLIQLRQSGVLRGVRGIVFGAMHECGPEEEIRETILDCLGDLGVPIGFGAPIGHGDAHLAVPLGVRVALEVDGTDGSLQGREALVG